MSDGLEVADLNAYYGTSHILFGIALEVRAGECVCLLGRNGVGKSTTLKSIMGLVAHRTGTVSFDGHDLIGLAPHQIARLGLGYAPDERLIFPDLTVRDNLEIAVKPAARAGLEPWTIERIYALFPKLAELDGRAGGYLSGGEQQMLTVGRALMGNPALLLLDEPVEGLAPVVVQELTRQIEHLKDTGLAILFAEQNLAFAARVAERAYIIEGGRVRYAGRLEDLEQQPEVKRQYLMV
ncbi:MAG: ABC transporter ATP-binding protein [Rhodoplanes sp.]|uniref:ABC transporter ATP-binding protein n=1 Tax=Rhodoplanes sp. TaxID=1968906 RepID=UPI0018418EDF|nr:ABC transporter ATP-binding protein [Rhodoplanes sp.]NVO15494.1 ABC transporter ATP-binding protein [Rhodoplanes sp.]